MTKRLAIPSVLLASLFWPLIPASSQNAPSTEEKQTLAINLLRAINTAEVSYQHDHGLYAPWAVLLDSMEKPLSLNLQRAPRSNPQLPDLHFSKGTEILPGWRLRLDLTDDGKGYDVLLEDLTDKACGYAALTDERGLIRQSITIDCEI